MGRPTTVRYLCEEDRLAARRRSYRENAMRQQDLYYEICERFDIPGQGRRWASHLAEIRHLINPCPENRELWEQCSRKPYMRWWLERYTLDEIRELGRGIDFLSPPDQSLPALERGRTRMVAA